MTKAVETNIGLTVEKPRRVKVLPLGRLTAGVTYEGWHCRGCACFIAIDVSWPEAIRIPDAHYISVICPQCKTERGGTWKGRETLLWVAL